MAPKRRGKRIGRGVYVADVLVSPNVASKIRTKHNVHPDEARQAFVMKQLGDPRRQYDPQRGWRLVVTGETNEGRRIEACLYPVDVAGGIWRLGTAIPAQ